MAEGVDYTHNFYAGADYGLDPGYADEFSLGMSAEYPMPASQLAVTTDPRTANQLKEVSDKLSTGAKTIEVVGVSAEVLESIPQQHLDEINKLKKITGIDLTFHGPVIEPSGITRYGLGEGNRQQAENQMWSAVERAHKLDPEGNIVVTFHSSEGVPTPIVTTYDEKTGKEEIKEFFVVDEQNERMIPMQLKPSYFKGEDQLPESQEAQMKKLEKSIEKQNKDAWFRQLQGVSYHANQGATIINSIISGKKTPTAKEEESKLLKAYEKQLEGKSYDDLLKDRPAIKEEFKGRMQDIAHGDIYLRDAYQDLQNLFNQSYEVAKRNGAKDDLKKLDKFRKEIGDKVGYIEDPKKMEEFSEVILEGVNVLRSIQPPQSIRPLRDFAIEKSSETFSNIALNAYNKFKDTAPIISVENPPVGIGLAKADDLREVVDLAREKFVEKAKEQGLSGSEAKKQAEKLLGVTWDVGHINMARKYGYGDETLIEETKKVAPYVKHVHLSDNFGMEHTELPMGMGNVPTKPMLEAIAKYNKQAKKIIEGGQWYQHFQTSPLKESLKAFGSPIYAMQAGPTWNQVANASGGYFAGYGQMLPEQHFSMYGSGFSNLPPELGGQMSGRSRVGGTPME